MNSTLKSVLGWVIILVLWYIVALTEIVNSHILPSPGKTFVKFIDILENHDLIENILFSLKINLAGYLEAVLIAVPLGFLLGLSKNIREIFGTQISAIRFVPITALGGLFVAISGFTIWTKIHFLSFGIMVYLVPVTVQRISEVNKVHLQMMQTLGASRLQIFWYVQLPSVMSRLSDDIRILVATSWTYIIVAELKGIQGGLGSLIFLADKQSSIAMVYDVIVIIVTLGIIQDKIFLALDWLIFRFKHS